MSSRNPQRRSHEPEAIRNMRAILAIPSGSGISFDMKLMMLAVQSRKWKESMNDEQPRTRKSRPRRDPKQSPFYLDYWIDQQRLYRYGSPSNMLHFERMFRMSHAALSDFSAIANGEKWFDASFPPDRKDAANRPGAPLIILIMGALSVLGGMSFASLPDLTYVSEETHRRFFKTFCEVGVKAMFPKWVQPPSTPVELQRATAAYTAVGFPGCIGSVDSVRIRLLSSSANARRQQNISKEGYPVRSFQITVGHNGKIYTCTRGREGKDPNQVIADGDPFFASLQESSLYKDFEWSYQKHDGTSATEKGAWLIVDDGYPDWICLQCPPKQTLADENQMRWGNMLESLRKDVERTFDSLVQRFQIFKKAMTLQSFELIDNSFQTACALHNYLLLRHESGLDESSSLQAEANIESRLYRPQEQSNFVEDGISCIRAKSQAFLVRRAMLSDHFNYLVSNDQIRWPRVVPKAGFGQIENEDDYLSD